MTIKALLDTLSNELVDPRNAFWSRESLMDYINQALSMIIILLPQEGRQQRTFDVTDGTVQAPAKAVSLLSADMAGNRALSFVDINKLNQLDPGWRTKTGQPSVWTQASGQYLSYELFPRPDSAVTVTDAWSVRPSVTDETEVLPINEVYLPAVIDFVMYRAYGKDGQDQSNLNKSMLHFQAFDAAMGGKAKRYMQRNHERDIKEAKR